MKRIVITRSQLQRINEEANVNIGLQRTGTTVPDAINTVTQNKDKINQASRVGDPVIHISSLKSYGGSDDNLPTQHVEVPQGETPEQAMQQQLNPSLSGDIEISGEGISERKTFKKKQIEEARLKMIKENGDKYKKKDLIKLMTK